MRAILIGLLASTLFIGGVNGQSLKRAGVTAPTDFQYNPEVLSVLSWNVEHFVDMYDNPYINNSREDNPKESMEGKEALLVKALKAANADVVVLQEFESIAYLKQIADSYLSDMGYEFFAAAESYSWYMNVVIMSKVPLGTVYSYGALYTPVVNYLDEKGKPESQVNLNSRMWSIDILPNEEYEFTLTGVHLKAGRGERNEKMRLGQINFLKNQWARIVKEDKKVNLMMVGDFNCTPDSEEFQTLLAGKKGNQFIDPLANSGVFSHPSDNPRWRIDHIIFNKNMMEDVEKASTTVFSDLLSKEEMMKLSDHLPMFTRIKVQ